MADDADPAVRELNGPGERDADTSEDDLDPVGEMTEPAKSPVRQATATRLAVTVGLIVIAALGGVTAWLSTEAHRSNQQEAQRALFLSVGRQGALNLTTIKSADADAAVQRILDSSTGAFHDDFQKNAGPFVDVLKETQSSTEGTITEAGVESLAEGRAQVLVAVSIKTVTPGSPEAPPRLWRMRLGIQKVDDGAKVSDVQFVS
jgi:Mce-associated membrane protein